jgi:hypothetical protein
MAATILVLLDFMGIKEVYSLEELSSIYIDARLVILSSLT